MSVKDTSLGLEAYLLSAVESISSDTLKELRERVEKLQKPAYLKLSYDKREVRLAILHQDYEPEKVCWIVAGKKGYATRYSCIKDMLVYEKMNVKFIDTIIQELRTIQFPN